MVFGNRVKTSLNFAFIGLKNNYILLKAIKLYIFFIRKKIIALSSANIFSDNIELFNVPDEVSRDFIYIINNNITDFIGYLKEYFESTPFLIVRLLNKLYKTNKFQSVFLSHFSCIAYFTVLEAFYLDKQKDKLIFILPNTLVYKKIGDKLLNKYEIHYSSFLSICIYLISTLEIIRSSFSIAFYWKLKRKRKEKGFILRELVWGMNSNRVFRDDMFVDNKNIKSSDMIYYTYSKIGCRKYAYDAAVKYNKRILDFEKAPKAFNLNRTFLFNFYYNFICAPALYLVSFFSLDFFTYIYQIIRTSGGSHRLISFADAKWHFSSNDCSDHIQTIVYNLYGTKNFLYHWSDHTAAKWYDQQTCCHNVVFSWGEIFWKYARLYGQIDKKVNVGCPFTSELNKNELKKKYGFAVKEKIITFYDVSFDDWAVYSKALCRQFYRVIQYIDLKLENNILILVKPKARIDFDKLNINLSEYSQRVVFLDPDKYPIEDVINLSDINIGCGSNTTTTISLINNIPGIYFDENRCKSHPMCKYENEIYVREKAVLLKKINDFLNFNSNIREAIIEINSYDTVNASNSVSNIRNFLLKI
jgi:hypothetical protein